MPCPPSSVTGLPMDPNTPDVVEAVTSKPKDLTGDCRGPRELF